MTLDEINMRIAELQTIKRRMEEADVEKNKQLARQFVGKCYRLVNSGRVIKIIGIPRTQLTLRSNHYNQFQYPALVLKYPDKLSETFISDDELYPCNYEDVYFDLWRGDKSKCASYFREITKEEFDAEFNKCIEHFKKQIDEMVSEYES